MADPLPIACPHVPEAHTLYDREAAGFRAALWCRCHKVKRVSRRLHDTHGAADVEAQAWATQPVKPRVRKPAAPKPAPVIVPAIPADQAWVMYWRLICARHGHESRL